MIAREDTLDFWFMSPVRGLTLLSIAYYRNPTQLTFQPLNIRQVFLFVMPSRESRSDLFMLSKKSFVDKLILRWGINYLWQIIILGVIALTGTSVIYAEKLLYDLLIISTNPEWHYSALLFIVIILPLYLVLLLYYGSTLMRFGFHRNSGKAFRKDQNFIQGNFDKGIVFVFFNILYKTGIQILSYTKQYK